VSTLGAETPTTDPLYDATDATNGGGNTGSVLISPYIKPGTVSTVNYNHYSWLRTMEDLFNVAHASPGLDGQGTSATQHSRASRRSVRTCSTTRRANRHPAVARGTTTSEDTASNQHPLDRTAVRLMSAARRW